MENELAEAFKQMTASETNGNNAVTTETTPVAEEVSTTETIDPLKTELERVKAKKTPLEKARDSLYFNALKAKELGIDPTKDAKLKEVLGLKDEVEDVEEDEKPVTRKELEALLKQTQQTQAVKTAEEIAQEIADETERELTLYHIQNTIKSTGNAQEDIKLARALVNSVKNSKILEEASRKGTAKTHSSASSASGETPKAQVELTNEEKAFLATGKITVEEILNLRGK